MPKNSRGQLRRIFATYFDNQVPTKAIIFKNNRRLRVTEWWTTENALWSFSEIKSPVHSVIGSTWGKGKLLFSKQGNIPLIGGYVSCTKLLATASFCSGYSGLIRSDHEIQTSWWIHAIRPNVQANNRNFSVMKLCPLGWQEELANPAQKRLTGRHLVLEYQAGEVFKNRGDLRTLFGIVKGHYKK